MTLLIDIETWSRNTHVSPLSNKPERTVRNSKAVSFDTTFNSEANFATQFARDRRVDDFWLDELEVLPKLATHDHVDE